MSDARELTTAEVRERFLAKVRTIVDYWADEGTEGPLANQSLRQRCEGVAFSILVTLDGEDAELPGFVVAPNPHPDDKIYCREHDLDWYPRTADGLKEHMVGRLDIAGSLHEDIWRKS